MFTINFAANRTCPEPRYAHEYNPASKTWLIKENEAILGCMFTETYAKVVVSALNTLHRFLQFVPVLIAGRSDALN